jgi:hypothetical protein
VTTMALQAAVGDTVMWDAAEDTMEAFVGR